MFNNVFSERRIIYGKMSKNTVEPETPHMTIQYSRGGDATYANTIRRMHLACWIDEARDTNSEHVILIALTLQQLSHDRASVLQGQRLPC